MTPRSSWILDTRFQIWYWRLYFQWLICRSHDRICWRCSLLPGCVRDHGLWSRNIGQGQRLLSKRGTTNIFTELWRLNSEVLRPYSMGNWLIVYRKIQCKESFFSGRELLSQTQDQKIGVGSLLYEITTHQSPPTKRAPSHGTQLRRTPWAPQHITCVSFVAAGIGGQWVSSWL